MTIRINHVNNTRDGVYVGRAMPSHGLAGSPLGNEFRSRLVGGRMAAIQMFEDGLQDALFGEKGHPERNRIRAELAYIQRRAKEPEGVTLLCWCYPQHCHAEVIRKFVLEHDFSC